MTASITFQGFFSYAHHDARTNPEIVEAFTIALTRDALQYCNGFMSERRRQWKSLG